MKRYIPNFHICSNPMLSEISTSEFLELEEKLFLQLLIKYRDKKLRKKNYKLYKHLQERQELGYQKTLTKDIREFSLSDLFSILRELPN